MDQKVVAEILREKGENPETLKAYRGIYNSMEKYEQQVGRNFTDDPQGMIGEFVNYYGYTSVISLNNHLRYIKYYLRQCGVNDMAQNIHGRDFDLSLPMQRAFVDSLDEVYRRNELVFSPDNGEAIYPLSSFAWMGLSLPEARLLPESDVDLKNRTITTREPLTFSKMPNEMADVLLRYQKAEISRKGNGQVKIADRIGPFIYKTSSAGSQSAGKPLAIGTATSFFTRVQEEYNKHHVLQINTTYKDIVTSGRYYKIRLAELEGTDIGSPSADSLLQQAFNTTRIEPGYIRHNYQMYKKAFGLK